MDTNKSDCSNIVSLIITLIGLPACGKTYFSNSLVNHLSLSPNNNILNNNNNNIKDTLNIYHIEYDNVFKNICEKLNNGSLDNWKTTRLEVYNQIYNITNSSNNEKIILLSKFIPNKIIYDTTNEHTEQHEQQVKYRTVNLFILDDNMYYKSMRFKFYQITKNATNYDDIRYCQIYFNKDVNKSIEINNKRINKNGVTNQMIEKMNELIEYPNIDKSTSSWERENTLFINIFNDNFNIDQINNEIKIKFNQFYENNKSINNNNNSMDIQQEEIEKRKEEDKATTKNNIIHQFDIHCRKIIGELIKSNVNINNNNNNISHPYSNRSKLYSNYKQHFLKTTLSQFIHENSDFIQQYSDIIPYKDQLLNNFKNYCLNQQHQ